VRRILGKAALLVVSIAFALLFCEALLRLFTDFPIHGSLANRIPDEILGYRMDPSLSDIDPAGFRNDLVPEHADIVTIGDSHTYGNNVSSADSWPRQLGRMAQLTVYNLGIGGFGPLQYHRLFDRAVELSPAHIIVGLYFPNDLYDVCSVIAGSEYWTAWARQRGYETDACRATVAEAGEGRIGTVQRIVGSTALGSASLYISDQLEDSFAPSWGTQTAAPVQRSVIISDGRNEGIITHGRLATQSRFMDLQRSDVALAFAITKDIVKEAAASAVSRRSRVTVLLVPSKVRAYFEYLRSRGAELPPVYYRAVENESRLVKEFSDFCGSLGITCVDGGQYVAPALESSVSVYPPTSDGHPTEVGYRAYAQAVFDALFGGSRTMDETPSPGR